MTNEERAVLVDSLHLNAKKYAVTLSSFDIDFAIEIFWSLDAAWQRDFTVSAQSVIRNATVPSFTTIDRVILVEIVRDVWADIYTS